MTKLTFIQSSAQSSFTQRPHYTSSVCRQTRGVSLQKKTLRYTSTAKVSTSKKPQPANTRSIEQYIQKDLPVAIVSNRKARLFRDNRNPMVYAGAVERVVSPGDRELKDCEPVLVCDDSFSCIGLGFYNSHSMFRVRLLRHLDQEPDLPWQYEQDIENRLQDAVSLRMEIGLPSDGTTVFRVVNGEGDRLSGLVVDRVAEVLVVSSSALWCEVHRESIEKGLRKVLLDCTEVIWRRNLERLRQDGLQPVDGGAEEALDDEGPDVVVREMDVKFWMSRFALTKGQKTGHYADQRENRVFLRELMRQRGTKTRVLDLFCYSGGFSVNAALGSEAVEVVAVDSSSRALDMGQQNAALNGVEGQVEFVKADVVKFLRDGSELFDVVIVDPPKFAPSAKALARATHKYRSLNMAAMRRVKKGGLLVTCTCSAAMTQNREVFVEIVRQAGAELGRELTLLKMVGAGGDHPVTPEMNESEYLTMCVFACR